MIIIAATGTTDRTNRYLHTKRQVTATKSLVNEAGDCCYCVCGTEIPVFANLDDEFNSNENDIFSWILKVPDNSTVTATLTNLDTSTDYIITDNTYGLFYDVDDLKDNVWAFIIKWLEVADAIGFGNYQMNITVKNSSNNKIFNKNYPKFRLLPYTCESAHETVRIQTFNSGYIEGGFDYRNISIDNPYPTGGSVSIKGIGGWIQQIRYYGQLDITEHPIEIDNILDAKRNLLQVQTKISSEYNLRLEFIKTDISDQIIYDNLLADYLLLSDYNQDNPDDLKNKKVSLLSVDSPQNFKNKTKLFNIKFADYQQNILKRHY